MRRDFLELLFYEIPTPYSNVGGWGAIPKSRAECDEHRSERRAGIGVAN